MLSIAKGTESHGPARLKRRMEGKSEAIEYDENPRSKRLEEQRRCQERNWQFLNLRGVEHRSRNHRFPERIVGRKEACFVSEAAPGTTGEQREPPSQRPEGLHSSPSIPNGKQKIPERQDLSGV